MACYHGKNGALSLQATGGSAENIAMLTSWTLNQSAETVQCTAMGDTAAKYMVGITSFEGTAECVWSTETTSKTDTSEVEVGTTYTAIFYVEDSTTAGEDLAYKGSVIVTGLEVSASMDDVVSAPIPTIDASLKQPNDFR